jgi:hypothetical protein
MKELAGIRGKRGLDKISAKRDCETFLSGEGMVVRRFTALTGSQSADSVASVARAPIDSPPPLEAVQCILPFVIRGT